MTKLIDRSRVEVRSRLGLALAVCGVAASLAGCRDEAGGSVPPPRPVEKAPEPPEGKLLPVGADAPDFETVAHDGTRLRLTEMRGGPVVLYFYPKDETPGCTAEAEAFRDESAALQRIGARVIGVSLDTIESHREFAKNHELSFPLVADAGGAIAGKYGVSTRNGFAERVTFIISADGKIARVFPEVRVSGHADEVLLALGDVTKAASNAPAAQ
jgi:thioredoxin-dependent peroxiredoxin